jgi:hypothetical protein
MAKVFLSFHHADGRLAESLASYLADVGHEIIRAETYVAAGDDWRSILSDALRGADAAVFLITPQAGVSSWLQSEAGAAMAYSRERGRPIVIPLILDDAPIPPPLSHVQALLGNSANLGDLARRLAHELDALLGRRLAREEEWREVQARVERTAADYIRESLNSITAREQRYRRVAYGWYVLGFMALTAGIAAAIWRESITPAPNGSWPTLLYFTVFGILIIVLLVALARYSFLLGKAFMVESLRNSDRGHAISFGEFYLKAFGDRAAWDEVREVLQHWNIDRGSAFISQDAKDFDPQLLATALEIAKVLRSHEKGGKGQ